MAVTVDIKALLEAGVHFGHKTSRWPPKMAPYIHSKRQDSHLIDLTQTAATLDAVLPEITKTVANGKQVLFVGTNKQLKQAAPEAAESCDMPFVTERWIGGMLTNVATVSAQIKKRQDLERRMASGDLEKRYNKLEVQRFQEEIDELNLKYGGIKNLNGKPGLVIVLDTIADVNAVRESKNLHIPVIGVVDTNANPDLVDFVIPANDDAIKGVKLLLDYFVAAVVEGKKKEEQ